MTPLWYRGFIFVLCAFALSLMVTATILFGWQIGAAVLLIENIIFFVVMTILSRIV